MTNAVWWIWNYGIWWFGLWCTISFVSLGIWTIVVIALSPRDDDGLIGDDGRVSPVKE